MTRRPNFFVRLIKPLYHVVRHVAYNPVTHRYPFERIRGYPRTRGFIGLDIDLCVGCGVCGYICPCQAIKFQFVDGRKFTYPAIDFGKCSFCGLCVEYCPRGALSSSDVVEIAGHKYEDLVYYPDELKIPSLKEIHPHIRYELRTEITAKGPRYVRRRVE